MASALGLEDFKAHLKQLDDAGAFPEPHDAFVYALKERQGAMLNEIVASHRAMLQPFIAVFSLPGLVGVKDMQYLADTLSVKNYWAVMRGLYFQAKDEWLDDDGVEREHLVSPKGDSQLFRAFIATIPEPDADNPIAHKSDMEMASGSFFNLTGLLLGDQQGQAYLKLERHLPLKDRQDSRYRAEHDQLLRLPKVVRGKSVEGVDDWITSFKRLHELPDDGVGQDPFNQMCRLMNLSEVSSQGTSLPQGIAQLISDEMAAVAHSVEGHLQGKTSEALACFGDTKSRTSVGRMPSPALQLIGKLSASTLEISVKRSIFNHTLIALLNGKTKMMRDSALASVINAVKDDVDWEYCVDRLSRKGSDALIELFGETEYFQAYLKVVGRAKVFTTELGV